MASLPVAPLLLGLLLGLLLAMILRGLRLGGHENRDGQVSATRGDLLVGLLTLAAFALGIFIAYVLFSLHG